ncbi:hypothetical protein [Sphingomonas sp. 28-63-12]|uniref:hypothetical protein n=1 Tax=Sphingomonas sp. 28-63-12 TaxID=1970434 RepID=UPI000BD20741|nr:MAG: hypothetical protein B7Y47_10590 [Sphingomonas sp. 28-63-12]
MGRQRYWRSIAGDTALAVAIATILAIVWTWRDWPMLSQLHLPDTDDVMRLQQIRDWLAGQSFRDVSQHRLGPSGLAMHWSRLPDLVPGAIIAELAPMLGRAHAELAAVILWPSLLFAAALLLTGRIARVIDPAIARTAIIVAAIAYPVTTLFMPGRIDHHGFQIVLLLVMVRALVARPGHASGAIIGLAACASLVIGLETAPFILAAGLLVWIAWAAGRPGAQLLGFGLALGLGLGFARIVFAPDGWGFPACDGFTRIAWQSAQYASFAPVILAVAGARMVSSRHRIAASGLIALAGAAILFPIARGCASPYGAVDPLLARLWLDNVGEAQSMLAAPADIAFGYVGLLAVGLLASLGCAHRRPSLAWAMVIGFQLVSLALCFLQLRGAYAGAILAAPALAAVITAARARGTGWLAGAWLGSAGMLYPLAAQAFVPAPAAPDIGTIGGQDCTGPAVMTALARLPTGTVIAPIDLGAYAIAATRHRLIAAPYHRNNAGNAAMYRFFLSPADRARTIAAGLGADYVLFCPAGFATLDPGLARAPNRLIGQLLQGRPPGWLHPIGGDIGASRIFAVERGLSSPPKPL